MEDIGFEPISNACKALILPIKLIPKNYSDKFLEKNRKKETEK